MIEVGKDTSGQNAQRKDDSAHHCSLGVGCRQVSDGSHDIGDLTFDAINGGRPFRAKANRRRRG